MVASPPNFQSINEWTDETAGEQLKSVKFQYFPGWNIKMLALFVFFSGEG